MSAQITTTYAAGTILLGKDDTRFKVTADGRLRLQGTGRWMASYAGVEKSYGPLVPEVKTPKIQWEVTEGETFGYLDDGREINITARIRANRWGDSDSNVREWFLLDADNNRVASGKADGLRAAKSAAIAAITNP